MDSPTYRITTERGVVIADGLPRSAPAIQLHEGKVAEKGDTPPKNLAPGESTFVVYPLDAEKGPKRPELRCTVTRTDNPATPGVTFVFASDVGEAKKPLANNVGEMYPDRIRETVDAIAAEPALVVPEVRRGGRRSRKADAS